VELDASGDSMSGSAKSQPDNWRKATRLKALSAEQGLWFRVEGLRLGFKARQRGSRRFRWSKVLTRKPNDKKILFSQYSEQTY
jgi:hypothetical protein